MISPQNHPSFVGSWMSNLMSVHKQSSETAFNHTELWQFVATGNEAGMLAMAMIKKQNGKMGG
jgi:hypothetical protein